MGAGLAFLLGLSLSLSLPGSGPGAPPRLPHRPSDVAVCPPLPAKNTHDTCLPTPPPPAMTIDLGERYRVTIPIGFDMEAAARLLHGLVVSK